jgi:hypothetical protein
MKMGKYNITCIKMAEILSPLPDSQSNASLTELRYIYFIMLPGLIKGMGEGHTDFPFSCCLAIDWQRLFLFLFYARYLIV